jgi:hypothetical protein
VRIVKKPESIAPSLIARRQQTERAVQKRLLNHVAAGITLVDSC